MENGVLHEKWMQFCIEHAEKYRGKTFPNPLVGSVLVSSNEIVEFGVHQKAGENHAERDLLMKLQQTGRTPPKDSILYVNLEPCCHYGKTPPCTEAIIQSGINKVVVGMLDPNPLVAGQGIKRLEEAGIEVLTGVLEAECQYLNRVFIKNMNRLRPYVTLKLAITIDGFVADGQGNSKWITGEKAREDVHKLRSFSDGMLIGFGTIASDNPSLNTRLQKDEPQKVFIVDRDGLIQGQERVFEANGAENVWCLRPVVHKGQSVQQIQCSLGPDKHFVWDTALADLNELGICHLFCEGGASLASSLLEQGQVDEIVVYQAPKVLGGGSEHLSMFRGLRREQLEQALELALDTVEILGQDVKIVYRSTTDC